MGKRIVNTEFLEWLVLESASRFPRESNRAKWKKIAMYLKDKFDEYKKTHSLTKTEEDEIRNLALYLNTNNTQNLSNQLDNASKTSPISLDKNFCKWLAIILQKQEHEIAKEAMSMLGTVKKDKEGYHHIVNSALMNTGKTHSYEDALIILTDNLNNQQIKEVTIVVDDLSFVFKIAPTIAAFLNRTDTKLCLLYGPKHGYSLLRGKELLLLYLLGVEIHVLDLKNTFQYHGFLFNYFPPQEKKSDNIPDFSNVEFYLLRNNVFDRGPIISRLEDTGVTRDNFIEATKAIHDKYCKSVHISEFRNTSFSEMSESIYLKWLETKFNNWADRLQASVQKNKKNEEPPAYAKYISSDSNSVKFSFEDVDFTDVYYRAERVVAYKVFQAASFLEKYCTIKDGLACFKPVNLFEKNATGGFHYTINPPFLEWNQHERRYEIAEGHSRFYALYLFGVRKPLKIRTVVVSGLPSKAFETKSTYLNGNAKSRVINNSWEKLPVEHEHFLENTITIHPRKIETVTHEIEKKAYVELAKILVEKGILTKDEANEFLPNHIKL